jgi:hypothetical protein
MPRQRIETLLIVLDEDDVRQIARLASQGDQDEILRFLTLVLAKKVEAALRRRCGEAA